MLHLKKLLAIAIIVTFLASIPLALAENNSQIIKVVYELKVDNSNARPSGNPGGGGKSGPSGYSLMGVSWKSTPIAIVVDSGSYSDRAGFLSAMTAASAEWDVHTGASLVSGVTVSPSSLDAESSSPDRVNEIMFGSISNTNVIAQTTVWYNTGTKAIVDFDMVLNTYFTWGNANANPTVMDIQNIATHELGHGFGLADLYQAKWSTQTMYGYSAQGETSKQTLDSGDIAGIQVLYGPL